MKSERGFVKIAFMIKNPRKYAVIQLGSHQYLISENQLIEVEKIPGKKGSVLTFGKAMLLKDKKIALGAPEIKVKIKAEIVDQFKDKKIKVAKFRAKSRYRRVKGHRQEKTKIKILKICS